MANHSLAELLTELDALLELDDAARDLRLQHISELDPERAQRLNHLLKLAADSSALEQKAAHATAIFKADTSTCSAIDANGQTRQLGAYQLQHELGHGGMGSVWLAERVQGGFHQQVAIKLLHTRFPNTEQLARFARERELLAKLNHPHIARSA